VGQFWRGCRPGEAAAPSRSALVGTGAYFQGLEYRRRGSPTCPSEPDGFAS
jgi:hypothetical protein